MGTLTTAVSNITIAREEVVVPSMDPFRRSSILRSLQAFTVEAAALSGECVVGEYTEEEILMPNT